MNTRPNIVLVHGAWAEGSCWTGVIERLQEAGYNVRAPQFPLTSLADDVARLRQVLAFQDGPTIVAGHSYGGQIITALGTDAPNVAGLDADRVHMVDVEIQKPYVADANAGHAAGQSLWGARSQFAVQRDEIAALLRGQVDVIFSDAAMGALVKAFLSLVTVIDLTAPEETGDVQNGQPLLLTASGSLIEQRPDLVGRWLARLLDADPWARENPERVTQIVAQDTGLPEDFVAAAFSPRVHRQLDLSLSPLRIALLQDKHDALLKNGFLAAPLDFQKLVDPRPLQHARELHARNHQLHRAS